MATYPEHEKLHAISDKSQAIGGFVDWLSQEKKIHLGQWGTCLDEFCQEDSLHPVHTDIQDLLAEFYDIDRDKLEDEKQTMLREIRKAHQT